jgi:uncharacterized protein (DUF1800 family)
MYLNKFKHTAIILAISLFVASCGGGGGGSSSPVISNPTVPVDPNNPVTPGNPSNPVNPGDPIIPVIPIIPVEPVVVPPTQAQASSFLLRSTMGIKTGEVEKVVSQGYVNWINNQFALPHNNLKDRVDIFWNAQKLATGSTSQSQDWFYQSFWKGAVTDEDQLRQRVNWALSQIFVVSFINDAIPGRVRGVANYYDILGKHAFGNFRDMLYDISMNPMMGFYLTYLRNQKEDTKTGRVPDENYAREVMQLFTIGLYQLNLDGTVKTDGNGAPVYTYTNQDIAGLAKVFTGLSFGLPSSPWYGAGDPEEDIVPMKVFSQYQSTGTKSFLGTSATNVSEAVDVLFNHPNVGPFFSKQMIQRLVTSNPSPAYVERVAKVFNNNGKGVRGDMKSVIMAILTDVESQNQTDYSGKLKEPILRMSNYFRATNTNSTSGNFMITNTDDSSYNLGQTPMRSPSVFNFYRPGYTPSQSNIANLGKVAPEFALADENSVAGYANIMQSTIANGGGNTFNGARDLQPDLSAFIANSGNPDALIDNIDLLLTGGKMNSATKGIIKASINTIPNTTDINKKRRVQQALYLTVASSDFLIQK